MKKLAIIILGFFITSTAFSQAEEGREDGFRSYYVILIAKDGEVVNIFKEGKGITAKIGEKTVTGTWYFKSEPDMVTIVGRKGEILGDVKLNEQKTLKLETDEPKKSGGMSVGIGFGPIGIGTGTGGGGPYFISYNMLKNQASFDKQKETREEKIMREYREKQQLKQQKK
ncbi:MAG: hypothetical protein HYU68_04485 [Bacteroidetes bacterium]|nr:hypothetical protein [Bacteroidota bacterium]